MASWNFIVVSVSVSIASVTCKIRCTLYTSLNVHLYFLSFLVQSRQTCLLPLYPHSILLQYTLLFNFAQYNCLFLVLETVYSSDFRLISMARNSLLCADVPLRNYSLTHSDSFLCTVVTCLLWWVCIFPQNLHGRLGRWYLPCGRTVDTAGCWLSTISDGICPVEELLTLQAADFPPYPLWCQATR